MSQNMIEYIRENGDEAAPRLAAGLDVFERLEPGSRWQMYELVMLVEEQTDLVPATIRHLVRAAHNCEDPYFRKVGKGRRTRYIRLP